VSENSEFEAEKEPSTEPAPAVEGDSGQYVEGDYGAGGSVPDEAVGSVEGGYGAGDYGAAGSVEETAGVVEGEYESGDYGAAGASGVREEHRLVDDEVEENEVVEEDVPGETEGDRGGPGRQTPPLP
jgi:hypothetical protein